jgi:DNA-binding transcriptional LysR family regulator
MSMDRFHAMETFIRVVDTGSFSAAARDLGIGQPSVSKLIAGLEDRLQVRLLVRTTRRLTTTEAGEIYYEHARRALNEANEAEAMSRGSASGLTGRLRVCAPVTFARLHIAPALGEFMERHPGLRLEIVMDDRIIDLLEENIDVAFRMGDLTDSSFTARKLASSDRLVLASPDYLERRGVPLSPGDLLLHEAITYSPRAGGAVWRFRWGAAETSVTPRTRLSFTAAEGVREGVLAGLGLAMASRWMFAPELEQGRVVPVLEDWSLSPVDLWAVYPAGRLPSSKARAFATWLSDHLSRGQAHA